ncbi:hypothetical protein EVAR_97110_1 [Eumeta japonica]|uniref:Uncharacterized protein n=1 Tax=Eumeta variegata TaxID=151549 RepID=A0A4C1WNP7_EUMVA|nr:hypothetical protein EVAR_97110_1 [Eumeta japonica]
MTAVIHRPLAVARPNGVVTISVKTIITSFQPVGRHQDKGQNTDWKRELIQRHVAEARMGPASRASVKREPSRDKQFRAPSAGHAMNPTYLVPTADAASRRSVCGTRRHLVSDLGLAVDVFVFKYQFHVDGTTRTTSAV